MRLSELKTGEKAIIVKVNGHGGFRKRLIEMGFIKGKKVKVVLNAPLKDPIEYEIIGYKISLRREEASQIEVLSEAEAKDIIKVNSLEPIIPEEGEDNEHVERLMSTLAEERHQVIRVALVGNPNCGKTSLFNIASGSTEHVGNYSGVTVDAKEGKFTYKGYKFVLVDLPGTYSLSAYSPEELYVRENLIDNVPDVVINVVDASNLERNLYLTTQVIDMNLRTVMALNMYDELESKGNKLDLDQLSVLLGTPICKTVGRSGKGIPNLLDTVINIYEQTEPSISRHIHINHGKELEKSIDALKKEIAKNSDLRARYCIRYLAIKYLEKDAAVQKLVESLPNRDKIISIRVQEEQRIYDLLQINTESAIVDAKYAFISGALAETFKPYIEKKPKKTKTDKIDAIVTNRWLAFPIFVVLLYLISWATFTLGEYPMQWIDCLVQRFGDFVGSFLSEGWLKDLLVSGVISGVGSVLVFLPNILILYFFISLMEDSGYMARAAFIVDKVMHRFGLHGKSFIPMIMGFGCNVPAIMATRMIESRKSRYITIAIIPFMSCAGRLPIFVLFAGAFMPNHAALALTGIYLFGIIVAMLSALILDKLIKDDDLPFVMELPPYRIPTMKAIGRHTWEKGEQYLKKMATVILIFAVVIWFLGYFPKNEDLVATTEKYNEVTEQVDAMKVLSNSGELHEEYELKQLFEEKQTYQYNLDSLYQVQQTNSYIGRLGRFMSPALEPLGFNWKMDVGLLTGIAAKELVLSTLGVMYARGSEIAQLDTPEDYSGDTVLQKALIESVSLPAAIAYMIFVLLYFPCIATFVAVKNETGAWKWAIISCIYTILVAWVMGFLAYNFVSLFI